MDDEVLARSPALIGVVLAGVDEGLFQPIAVHRDGGVVAVFLDDREQVTQQALLRRRQVGVGGNRPRADVIDLVYRRPGGWRQGRGPTMRAVSRSGAVGPGPAP
jgi:hypothetical protein